MHSVSDPLVYSHQGETASILLMVDVCTDKGSNSGGVDVGHAGEIQDQLARSIASYQRLKWKEVRDRNRAAETQHTIVRRSMEVFNVQRLLWHLAGREKTDQSNEIPAWQSNRMPCSPETMIIDRDVDENLDYTQYQKAPTFAVSCESLEHHTYRKGAPL